MTRLRGADAGIAAPTNINKGAWGSGVVYAAGDQVTNLYGLYAALVAVPSGLAAPSANPTYPNPNGQSNAYDATNTFASNQAFSGGPGGFYQSFTTGASGASVAIVMAGFASQGAVTGQMGIASAVGADPSGVVWVGGVSNYAAISTSGGDVTGFLPAPITLAASTTYYFVITGGAASSLQNQPGGTRKFTGSIASTGTLYSSSGPTTAWSGNVSQPAKWGFGPTPLSYWSKIANLGADPASVVNKGAWSSATAYAVGDQVTRSYGLYAALLASTNQDPSATAATNASVVGTNVTQSSASSTAAAFTPTSTITISSIDNVLFNTAGSGTMRLGITATAPSGSATTSPTYLGVTGTLTAPGAGATIGGTLNTPVTLTSGTTYYLVAEGVSGSGAGGISMTNVAPTVTGLTAPLSNYYVNASSTWATQSGYQISNFRLVVAAYWSKIANTGNQENVNTVATSGAAQTIPDPEVAPANRITLTANCTFTFPTPAAGKSFSMSLVQDATGSRTVTWPASVLWPGGTAPTLTTTANKRDVFSFQSLDGTNWLGFTAGLNY